jgi:hypothetical protein
MGLCAPGLHPRRLRPVVAPLDPGVRSRVLGDNAAFLKETLTVEEQALVEHGSRLAAGLRVTAGFTANLQVFRR